MKKLVSKIQSLKEKQKSMMDLMSKEKCKDINSVLRSKQYAESIIELEIKIQILLDAVVAVS
jgi:hypothetical protein